jgi:DNA-binding PadR family transcriptional regulator
MWLGKFLNLSEDLPQKLKARIAKSLSSKKITPLEFTILESIFNLKEISGYDLIDYLNEHFAGTWKARSGTIYPLLSKLKQKGLLNSRKVKSPIGPLRKLYSLTSAGREIIKTKVNKHYQDQLTFTKNFLIELSAIYVQSFPANQQESVLVEIRQAIQGTLEDVIKGIEIHPAAIVYCRECGAEVEQDDSVFCPKCGNKLDGSGN